jgi:beta-glucosidase
VNATTGEHIDISSLNLVGAMGPLVQAVIATGKPTVVVFQSGKPVTEPWIYKHASAVVQQFYPGEQGGAALADVLFGDVNPSGKLSVGVPHDVGSLPVFYDFLNSGRPADPDAGQIFENGTIEFGSAYVIGTPMPQYEFGYGLSYSNFTYANVAVSALNVSAADTVTVSVDVTNEGPFDGKEVVQVYVRDLVASVAVPNSQLRGFKKVFVRAGETVNVQVELKVQEWGLWDVRMRYVVEPGEFLVAVGRSSADWRGNATVTVV